MGRTSVNDAFGWVCRWWPYQSDVRTPAQFPDLVPGIRAYLSWVESLPVTVGGK